MKNIMNQKGFTLIEMLIVLLIISVLILITVPNLTKHNDTVDEKGCEAYKKIVSSQVQLYKLENQEFPTIDQLVDSAYIEQSSCPNGSPLSINKTTGEVTEVSEPSSGN
ncbi:MULTISPECIES: competence type IV pilus major pilin ComGC [Allobacillus]|nr:MULTISPECIES: competence type IV pilus major pilin ComGC [Allobacillus]TSJ68908.1 prepilin-type N-terminal cleavage/methylation domain-containing protein [Allobacillus sp. SKP2-8]